MLLPSSSSQPRFIYLCSPLVHLRWSLSLSLSPKGFASMGLPCLSLSLPVRLNNIPPEAVLSRGPCAIQSSCRLNLLTWPMGQSWLLLLPALVEHGLIMIQASEASYGIITRFKNGVVCSTTPPRSLVLPGPKGVQSVLGGWENVFKGSWTSPS